MDSTPTDDDPATRQWQDHLVTVDDIDAHSFNQSENDAIDEAGRRNALAAVGATGGSELLMNDVYEHGPGSGCRFGLAHVKLMGDRGTRYILVLYVNWP